MTNIEEGMKFYQNVNPKNIVTVTQVDYRATVSYSIPEESMGVVTPMWSFLDNFTYMPNVLHVLKEKMEKHPQLRLGQLIEVVMNNTFCDLFNIQDEDLIKLLDKDLT